MARPQKAIVGEKVGMTQLWDESGKVVPVTVLRVRPIRVVRVKTTTSDGYDAVQITYGAKKASSLNKPDAGQFVKVNVEPGRKLLELRLTDTSAYEAGQEIKLEDTFAAGERVDVTAVSKGKGHAGVMKRHNFKGQGAAHGNHAKHRTPGSIGACATPGRVFKGVRMAGRMGGERVTTLGLQVVKADGDSELLLVRGSVPGPRGGTVLIRNAVKGTK
jgi:large subunit ribosomal protein L3